MKKTIDDIQKLNKDLKKYSKEYYLHDQSTISDEEYDGLYLKYSQLIKKHPQLEPEDSILKDVGAKIDNRFKKVEHQFPMLSLSNAFNKDDVFKFNKRILDQLHLSNQQFEYVIEPKIDGLSISLIYKQGKLVQGITRGDGKVGEDVTHNIFKIKDIPKTIYYLKDIEFRGEIYMSKKTFKQLNQNDNNFANPRNAASGTLRQLDSEIVNQRNLQSFIYAIPNPLEHGLKTQQEVLSFIDSQGLSVNSSSKVHKGLENIYKYIDELTSMRNNLDYEIDGIVLKINNINLYEDIGFTVKFPKFMTAYKFPAEKVQTKLLAIFPTVGRTGRITYNAKLNPVRIAGTVVSSATLHNADYIKNININVGDVVIVKKAGDIIPKVVNIKVKHNNDPWQEPKICNSCNATLVRKEEEVDQYCPNQDCSEMQYASLEHFVSRNAMNIEGLSTEILKTFKKEKFIENKSDIFNLFSFKNKIVALDRFQEKSTSNILKAIEAAKNVQINKFIFALGIRYVGLKKATIISKRFGSVESLIDYAKNKKADSIWNIRDIGPKVKNSIIDYFSVQEHIDDIQRMQSLGVNIIGINAPKSRVFEGKTFVITGTLSKSRNYFKKIIEENSGDISNAVSSKTDFLLVGENAGSKKEKALENQVKIITEQEFIDIIEGVNYD